MSCSLNSLKGGYIGFRVLGSLPQGGYMGHHVEEDTRS